MTLYIVIPGPPMPAVRMTRNAKYVRDHRDADRIQRHLAYKDLVGLLARQAGADPDALMSPPLALDVTVYARKRGRWDGDNVLKLISDGLQGVAFRNDTAIYRWQLQIVTGVATSDERVEVALWEMPS